MVMKRKAIIVDLDGTLCNHDLRQQRVIDLGYKNLKWEAKHYDEFYKGVELDDVHHWCRDLVRLYLTNRYFIVFLTGRPEKYRAATRVWIHEKVGLIQGLHYELYMRPDGMYDCDTTVKKQTYLDKIRPSYNIDFVLEDRNKVVRMWRELGLTCLHVAEGDF
jgi:hypothetical protein